MNIKAIYQLSEKLKTLNKYIRKQQQRSADISIIRPGWVENMCA